MSRRKKKEDGEFLWLVSLSDLMILLFVFFVVLFSFAAKKMTKADYARAAAALNNQEIPKTPIDEVQTKLEATINERKLSESVTIEKKDDALIMHIRDKILFPSAEFALQTQGQDLIKEMGNTLNTIPAPYKIGIEGHTDDIPIRTSKIADNWELSTKRAHTILHALTLKPEVLHRAVIVGYGEMEPIVPNRSPAGQPLAANQAKNRRVTIRIY